MREIVVNVPEELFAYVTEWLNMLELEVKLPAYKKELSEIQKTALIASVEESMRDYEQGRLTSIEDLEKEEW